MSAVRLRPSSFALLLALTVGATATTALAEPGHVFPALTPAEKAAIADALPAKARVAPAKPRKLLVFYRTEGFVHGCIPYGNEALRRLGEASGAYTAVLSEDMAMFDPATLATFDAVVFQNTTKLAFANPAQRKALLDFVASGKGVVGLHAATDNFPTWPEGQALIGGLFHGHPWTSGNLVAVKLDDPDHVLNTAFHHQGFWIKEEIYQIMGPYARDHQRVLLSLDMSRPENARPADKIARTDNDFPISWIKNEGAGRVFYSSLGHNKDIFNVPSILQHFLDGIQFALGDLPADAVPSARLPAAPAPALAPDDKTTLQELAAHSVKTTAVPAPLVPAAKLAAPSTAAPVTDSLAQLARYDYGQDTSVISSLEATLRGQSSAERAAGEPKLLALITADGTPAAAKQALIRCLLLTATPAAVPALEKSGMTEVLAADAARTLAGIADPSADVALLRLAANAPAASRATFINALGQRRSASATDALARIAKTAPSPAEADAAVEALARIGTPASLAALAALPLEGPQAEARTRALLAAADTVIRRAPAASRPAVAKMARSVLSTTKLIPYRIEAAQILLAADGENAVAELLPLTRDPALRIRQSIARSLALSGLPSALTGLDAAFASLPADTQAAVVSAAYDSGTPALMPLVKTALSAGDVSIRPLAARADGRCGDETTVDLLIPLLTATPDLAAAAKEGLGLLPAGKADILLLDKLARADAPAAKVTILAILAGRQQRAAFPAALTLCSQADATVRASAFEAVAKLARAEDFPLILALTPNLKKAADRREWRKALFSAASAQPKNSQAIALIQTALAQPDAPESPVLIGALTVLPGEESTKVLRALLASPDAAVRKDIIRALAAARSEGAYALLKETAQNSKESSEQTLALRGYLETLAALDNLKPAQRVEGYRAAWPLASRPEEKAAILAAVKEIKGKDAEKFLKEFAPAEPKPTAKA